MGTKYNNMFDKKKDIEVKDELTFEKVEETIVNEEPKKDFVKVVPEALYVRYAPSKDSDHITIVEKGNELMVTGDAGEWYEVVTPSGAEGYVMKEFVK